MWPIATLSIIPRSTPAGVSVFPIMTLPSGERYGGVKDPCGNIWWVATHVEDVPPDEQERRWKEFEMP
jgi:hypothetical protein